MFQAKPMAKLLIAAPSSKLEAVIRELYRHHLFHIEDFIDQEEEGYEGFRIGMPLSEAGAISSELLRIRSAISNLGLDSVEVTAESRMDSSAVISRMKDDLPQIESDVGSLVAKRTKLENSIKEYEQRIKELTPFAEAPVDLDLYRGYDSLSVFAGHIPAAVSFPFPAETYFSNKVSGNFFAVFVSTEDRVEAERILLDAHFQPIPVPQETGAAGGRIAYYRHELENAASEMAGINAAIADGKEKHALFLAACEELLTAEVQRAEVPLRFATTNEAFVAEGWVPAEQVDALTQSLRAVADGKVFVTELEVDPGKESVPVEYNNPNFSKPSEMLMDVYSRPRYDELDPTILLSIVFPIFFGLILGDVGYGLILLALSFGLRRFLSGDAGKMLLDVLRNASVSSIVFGLLFSEFLGFSLPWNSVLFSRHLNIGVKPEAAEAAAHAAHHGPQVAELLVVSVWIGILHITLGRILGMRNARKLYHGKHATKAVIANAGWLGVMWGILLLIWSFFPIPLMPDLTGIGIAVQAAGVVLLLAGIVGIAQENVLDVVELPTIISHVLSYARIVAVGLSSVAIAMVINYLAIGKLIGYGTENLDIIGVLAIIAGLLVFLIGHTLNTALGLLGGGLHSIRLHYVEFFTKFYKGGGKKYEPFGIKKVFTED
jgi:V/A-type H+-transporting ATPase subunit I